MGSVNRGDVTVTVLEQGSKVIYRSTVVPDLPGRYVITGGWLVYESYPRAEEEHRRLVSEQAAEQGRPRESSPPPRATRASRRSSSA